VLYSAKVELNNHVTSQSNVSIEGWSKVVNKQCQPVVRKAAKASLRRIAESEDVLYMLAAIDVHKVDLPKFVAADLDRIPVVAGLSRSTECGGSDNSPTNQFASQITQLSATVEGLQFCTVSQLNNFH